MPHQDKPMPNLFLGGSMKSETATLHRYQITHPEIFMTEDPKEPTYFLDGAQLLDVLVKSQQMLDTFSSYLKSSARGEQDDKSRTSKGRRLAAKNPSSCGE